MLSFVNLQLKCKLTITRVSQARRHETAVPYIQMISTQASIIIITVRNVLFFCGCDSKVVVCDASLLPRMVKLPITMSKYTGSMCKDQELF